MVMVGVDAHINTTSIVIVHIIRTTIIIIILTIVIFAALICCSRLFKVCRSLIHWHLFFLTQEKKKKNGALLWSLDLLTSPPPLQPHRASLA